MARTIREIPLYLKKQEIRNIAQKQFRISKLDNFGVEVWDQEGKKFLKRENRRSNRRENKRIIQELD